MGPDAPAQPVLLLPNTCPLGSVRYSTPRLFQYFSIMNPLVTTQRTAKACNASQNRSYGFCTEHHAP